MPEEPVNSTTLFLHLNLIFLSIENRNDLPFPLIYLPSLFQLGSAYPPNSLPFVDLIIIKVDPLLSIFSCNILESNPSFFPLNIRSRLYLK